MNANMLSVLEKMWLESNHEAFVHMSTAWALEGRGLVEIGNIPKATITEGGNFPSWRVSLTKAGEAFCRKSFGDSEFRV